MREFYKELNLSDEFKEHFTGFMLGDGYLSNQNKSAHSTQFIVTNKHPEYAYHVSRLLTEEHVDHIVKIRDKQGGFKGSRASSSVYTKFYVTFLEAERRWYTTREDGTHFKRVPEDLTLTPTSLLHWFIGDGYLVNLRGEPVRVQFCTDRYTDDEIVFLQEVLRRDVGLDVQIDWNRRRLRIPKRGLAEFYAVLPPCPGDLREVLGYKWA